MKLLVTGGAGFIGSAFVRLLLTGPDPFRVTVLDKLTYAGNLDNLAPVAADARYRFVKGDIADPVAVAEQHSDTDCIAVRVGDTQVHSLAVRHGVDHGLAHGIHQ